MSDGTGTRPAKPSDSPQETARSNSGNGANSSNRGHVFVIAAPSGTGKTTICRALLDRDAQLQLSVSHTTRPMRKGEVDATHYHFVSTKEFRELNEADAFLEHAEYGGNNYGTSWAAIEKPLEDGLDVILEIEVQGAAQVKERRPDAHMIFLLPPSLIVLEERLRGRKTDSEEVIQKRMALVDRELASAPIFDFAVVNDDLETAVQEVLRVIVAIRKGEEAALGDAFGLEAVLSRWLLPRGAKQDRA